ncbi:CD82 antigen [Puma concolor]|uniref:CD82 antigen n=1 Tax=Puma concolor TaxID=9696 RepID=A0A6P6I897_PUMCO|nr:CD82 antigen [Puma concolor]
MGSACIKVTKYFLFLFNLLFFILGAVILGFGVWILADRSSFISVLQTSSSSLKVGASVFIGVGAVTMFMGFLGCIGAIKEVRCLLGLYFAFLLLILIAQVTAGALFYFNMGQGEGTQPAGGRARRGHRLPDSRPELAPDPLHVACDPADPGGPAFLQHYSSCPPMGEAELVASGPPPVTT